MNSLSTHQTILYAEDTENDVILMKEAIARAGAPIELISARDGDEVVRYLNGEGKFANRRNHPIPDLLLLDLKLPGRNGFQVLQWLRQRPHLKRMVAIILTASRRQEDIDQAHELGANAVLVKPSTIEELVHLVSQLCSWMELTSKPTAG